MLNQKSIKSAWMNKHWRYILFFGLFSVYVQAQSDTLADGVEPLVEVIEAADEYVEPEIIPLELLQKDTLFLEQKKFSSNYKEKYTSTEFIYSYERLSEKTWWDRLKEFVQDLLRINTNPSLDTVSFIEKVMKISAYIIILVLLALLIRYIIVKDVRWIFRKKPKELVEVYDLEQDIHEVDFDKLIKDAVEREQYRSAVRYHFLRMLKIMSEKQIIKWNPDKTNHEYAHEISSDKLKQEFDYLAYVYENIWYGEFDIDQAGFEKIRQKFNQTIQHHLS